MKRLTRLFFASTLAFSAPVLALEALEDEALSEAMGQAGLTLAVTPPVAGYSFSLVFHDTDPAIDGAFVIGRPLAVGDHIAASFSTAGNPINILIDAAADVDAVTAGSQGAGLNINITLPANTVLHTGTISAAQSNGAGVAISNQTNVILNDQTITLPGITTINLNLGNEATGGQMMRLATNMTAGLTLTNVAVRDANAVDLNGTAIRAASIVIDNTGGATNLNVDASVDAIPTGLRTTINQFGVAGTGAGAGVDIKMNTLRLGDTTTTSMGNLNILGLNLNGSVLTLYGH